MKSIFNSDMKITQFFGNDFWYNLDLKCTCDKTCKNKDNKCVLYYKYHYNLSGHNGIDVIPKDNDCIHIKTILGGSIFWYGYDKSYGSRVVIWNKEKNLVEAFSHLLYISHEVRDRKIIEPEMFVGIMGNTGASLATHCHYQMAYVNDEGKRQDLKDSISGWIDPLPIIKKL